MPGKRNNARHGNKEQVVYVPKITVKTTESQSQARDTTKSDKPSSNPNPAFAAASETENIEKGGFAPYFESVWEELKKIGENKDQNLAANIRESALAIKEKLDSIRESLNSIRYSELTEPKKQDKNKTDFDTYRKNLGTCLDLLIKKASAIAEGRGYDSRSIRRKMQEVENFEKSTKFPTTELKQKKATIKPAALKSNSGAGKKSPKPSQIKSSLKIDLKPSEPRVGNSDVVSGQESSVKDNTSKVDINVVGAGAAPSFMSNGPADNSEKLQKIKTVLPSRQGLIEANSYLPSSREIFLKADNDPNALPTIAEVEHEMSFDGISSVKDNASTDVHEPIQDGASIVDTTIYKSFDNLENSPEAEDEMNLSGTSNVKDNTSKVDINVVGAGAAPSSVNNGPADNREKSQKIKTVLPSREAIIKANDDLNIGNDQPSTNVNGAETYVPELIQDGESISDKTIYESFYNLENIPEVKNEMSFSEISDVEERLAVNERNESFLYDISNMLEKIEQNPDGVQVGTGNNIIQPENNVIDTEARIREIFEKSKNKAAEYRKTIEAIEERLQTYSIDLKPLKEERDRQIKRSLDNIAKFEKDGFNTLIGTLKKYYTWMNDDKQRDSVEIFFQRQLLEPLFDYVISLQKHYTKSFPENLLDDLNSDMQYLDNLSSKIQSDTNLVEDRKDYMNYFAKDLEEEEKLYNADLQKIAREERQMKSYLHDMLERTNNKQSSLSSPKLAQDSIPLFIFNQWNKRAQVTERGFRLAQQKQALKLSKPSIERSEGFYGCIAELDQIAADLKETKDRIAQKMSEMKIDFDDQINIDKCLYDPRPDIEKYRELRAQLQEKESEFSEYRDLYEQVIIKWTKEDLDKHLKAEEKKFYQDFAESVSSKEKALGIQNVTTAEALEGFANQRREDQAKAIIADKQNQERLKILNEEIRRANKRGILGSIGRGSGAVVRYLLGIPLRIIDILLGFVAAVAYELFHPLQVVKDGKGILYFKHGLFGAGPYIKEYEAKIAEDRQQKNIYKLWNTGREGHLDFLRDDRASVSFKERIDSWDKKLTKLHEAAQEFDTTLKTPKLRNEFFEKLSASTDEDLKKIRQSYVRSKYHHPETKTSKNNTELRMGQVEDKIDKFITEMRGLQKERNDILSDLGVVKDPSKQEERDAGFKRQVGVKGLCDIPGKVAKFKTKGDVTLVVSYTNAKDKEELQEKFEAQNKAQGAKKTGPEKIEVVAENPVLKTEVNKIVGVSVSHESEQNESIVLVKTDFSDKRQIYGYTEVMQSSIDDGTKRIGKIDLKELGSVLTGSHSTDKDNDPGKKDRSASVRNKDDYNVIGPF